MGRRLSFKVSESLPGAVAVRIEGQRRVLHLSGEVDFAVVEQFERGQVVPLVVDEIDAGAVTYFSAAGVRLLLQARKTSLAAGRPATLRSSSPNVDRLLGVAGILIPSVAA